MQSLRVLVIHLGSHNAGPKLTRNIANEFSLMGDLKGLVVSKNANYLFREIGKNLPVLEVETYLSKIEFLRLVFKKKIF